VKELEIDKVLHQPVRTKIMALLVSMKECDYTSLKKTLGLSDGHMSTHMRELIEAGCVEVEKSFVDNKPKTTYRLTKEGSKRFAQYIKTLKQVIALK
jgi:predicted ArsR family transcriptional regulator